MMNKIIYGLSRTRNSKGEVVKWTEKPYVNCIHTYIGGRMNMGIFVIEYESDTDREHLFRYSDIQE